MESSAQRIRKLAEQMIRARDYYEAIAARNSILGAQPDEKVRLDAQLEIARRAHEQADAEYWNVVRFLSAEELQALASPDQVPG